MHLHGESVQLYSYTKSGDPCVQRRFDGQTEIDWKAGQASHEGLVYLIIPPISSLTPLRFSAASLVRGSLSG